MPILGYEYEDWLLEQWADWSRATPIAAGYMTGGVGQALPASLSDDDMLLVDGCVARLPVGEKKAVKGYYWRREYDDYQEEIKPAIRRFSNYLEDAKYGLIRT